MGESKNPRGNTASSKAGVQRKIRPPYNEKSAIRSALRQEWRKHPVLQEVLKRERIERPFTKKDGSIGKRPRVLFKCYKCKEEFARKDIQIDHLEPVGPTPGSKLAPASLTWDIFIMRMFCGADNLATVCTTCHKTKTDAETKERFRRLNEAS